jgi:transposase
MSKNKVIVLAVLEGGMSKSEAARRCGVGRQWVQELLASYAAGRDAGLEPRFRRPRSSPQATGAAVQARILALRTELGKKGLDAP